ncbi:MAG: exodeoxyribonuclease III [Myxococcota bacterium]
MKIATWNVNSMRAREDLVLDWIETHEPDIVCLQETKVTDQEFPEDAFGDLDYDVVYYGQQSYNGVAIAAREELEDVVRGFPGDGVDDERRLIAATVGGIRVIDIYLPNGQSYASKKYRDKLDWMDQLQAFIDSGPGPETPVVLLGDFNIAPRDIDVHEDYATGEELFVSGEERARFQRLLDWGLTDSVLHFDKAAKQFTWWDYRAAAFERNLGMRIDHILVSKPILDRSRGIFIDREARAAEGPSDHCPVILELDG